jgi:fibronectin type 3 domain-containing protein
MKKKNPGKGILLFVALSLSAACSMVDDGPQDSGPSAKTKPAAQLALNISAVIGTDITLAWIGSAAATGYNVYYYSGPNPDTDPFTLLTLSPLSETTLAYTDATHSVTSGTHYYKVVALNADGNEGVSSEYICTVPRNGRVIFLGTKSLTLSWEGVPDVVLYKIYRSTTSGGPYTPIPEDPPTITTPVSTPELVYTDSHKPNHTFPYVPHHAVDPGTTYYYAVSAVYPGGFETDLAALPAFEFSGSTLPAAPAVTALLLPSDAIELSWTPAPSPPGISYNIYHSLDIAGPYTRIESGVTAPPYTHNGLDPGIRHFYKICTVYGGREIDFGTSISSPAAPADISAAPASSSSITVSWTAVSGESYTIYRSTSSAGPYTQLAAGLSASPHTDSGLPANTTYHYKISTVIGGFEGPRSQPPVSATTDP